MERTERGRQGLEPQRIISDNTCFEITVPNMKKVVSMRISPDGFVSTKVENLAGDKEERLRLETNFTEVTRNYISAELNSKAASQIDTTDGVGPDLLAISLERQVGDGVKTLYQKGYSEEEIKGLVLSQARQFSGGETHMGEMPSMVREIVVSLNTRIGNYFENAGKIKKKGK